MYCNLIKLNTSAVILPYLYFVSATLKKAIERGELLEL